MCAFIFLALDIVQESSVGGGNQEAQMVDDRLWTMLLWMYYLVVLVEVLSGIIVQRLWTWYVLVLGGLEYYSWYLSIIVQRLWNWYDLEPEGLEYYCTTTLDDGC